MSEPLLKSTFTQDELNEFLLLLAPVQDMELAIEPLLAAGAQVNARDQFGCTVFMVAVEQCTSRVKSQLLAAGADVNARNLHGTTALMYAATTGDLHSISFLLAAGADPTFKNQWGKTALDMAVELADQYDFVQSFQDVVHLLQAREQGTIIGPLFTPLESQ